MKLFSRFGTLKLKKDDDFIDPMSDMVKTVQALNVQTLTTLLRMRK